MGKGIHCSSGQSGLPEPPLIMQTFPYTVTDLSALVHNARLLKSLCGDFYCVVKCCAYGHGDTECVKALQSAGMRRYAVSNLTEALRIRPYAPDSEILVLGSCVCSCNAGHGTIPCTLSKPGADISELLLAADNSLTLTLHDAEEAARISETGQRRLPYFHIKLDTGMHRSGFECDPESIFDAVSRFGDSVTGIYTHFPRADAPDFSETEKQLERFNDTAEKLEKLLSRRLMRHTAASPAFFRLPKTAQGPLYGRGLCRIGLALYGVLPGSQGNPDFPDFPGCAGLKPVMSFYSAVSGIRHVKKGEYIGYGSGFRCGGDMIIATVCGGYANGILRYLKTVSDGSAPESYVASRSAACAEITEPTELTELTELTDITAIAEINGFPVRLAGTPCMDRCMFDVTPIFKNGGTVSPGDRVVFFDSERPVSKYASAMDTISYEALTTVGNLNTRYIKP